MENSHWLNTKIKLTNDSFRDFNLNLSFVIGFARSTTPDCIDVLLSQIEPVTIQYSYEKFTQLLCPLAHSS